MIAALDDVAQTLAEVADRGHYPPSAEKRPGTLAGFKPACADLCGLGSLLFLGLAADGDHLGLDAF